MLRPVFGKAAAYEDYFGKKRDSGSYFVIKEYEKSYDIFKIRIEEDLY